jgi:hypothetical protein
MGRNTYRKKKQTQEAPLTRDAEFTLPSLPAYSREYFFSIDLPELFADILLVVFAFLISDELFSGTGIFLQLENWQVAAMYGVVVLMLPWYLGFVYVRNSAFYGKKTMRVFLWTFILMTLMILVALIRLVISTDWAPTGGAEDEAEFTGAFSVFLLVLGPMMCFGGANAAYQSFSSEGDDAKKFRPDRFATSGALLVIVLAVAFMIYFIGESGDSAWAVIGAFIGGPLAAVIVYGLFLGLLSMLDNWGLYRRLSVLAQNLFPFLVTAVLVFWAGVAIHFMRSDFQAPQGLSTAEMLFSITVSGLVPFRIVMLFNAPLRIVNIVIGLISLAFFMGQMYGLVG